MTGSTRVEIVTHQALTEYFNFFKWSYRYPDPIIDLATVYHEAFPHIDTCNAVQTIQREISQGHRYLVALQDDGRHHHILGFVSWRVWGDDRHQLAELYHLGASTEPAAIGIGPSLIQAMIEAAHEHYRRAGLPGARHIFLLTHLNGRAKNLYRHCGFEPQAVLPQFFHPYIDEDHTGAELLMSRFFPEHIVSSATS